MRRAMYCLLVVAAIAAFPVTMNGVCEEEYFTVSCKMECDFGSGYCTTANPERVCWEHVSGGSCAEGAIEYASECQPGGCGL